MAIQQAKDIENGDLVKPLIIEDINDSKNYSQDEKSKKNSDGSLLGWFCSVLLLLFVAHLSLDNVTKLFRRVINILQVGYSSTTQAGISNDLNLSLHQYSMFGSIVTIGAMIGAITSGQISDYTGQKRAMRLSAVFCIIGWLQVYFSMAALLLDTGRLLTGVGIGIFIRGSGDGSVYIYDVVSGAQVAKLDYQQDPVRDCSWHPYLPMIVSSSWDGAVAQWEFPGDGQEPVRAERARRKRRFVII